MTSLASSVAQIPSTPNSDRLADLEHEIEHLAHLLPSQGPITVFVHHNTLHAFEDRPFDEAVRQALRTFHCRPYWPEQRYREELARGRIRTSDLEAVLLDDLDDSADELIGFMGTRYHLRMAMLEHPLRHGSDAELRWLIAETNVLRRYRLEAPPKLRESPRPNLATCWNRSLNGSP